jgi:hypothetical protein
VDERNDHSISRIGAQPSSGDAATSTQRQRRGVAMHPSNTKPGT